MNRISYETLNQNTAGLDAAVSSLGLNRKPYFHDLPELGSIEQYYRTNFKSEYLSYLRTGLSNGLLPLEKHSRKVPEPDIISVTDIKIEQMHFTAVSNEVVLVEAKVRAYVHLYEKYADRELTDDVTQLYKIDGRLILKENFLEYSLFDNAHIFFEWNKPAGLPLSQYLIPLISREGLDKEAEQILQRFYPSLLKYPGKLDARLLAESMGLVVKIARLSPDSSILGQIFFEDDVVLTYKNPSHPGKMKVAGKTILIDEEAILKAGSRISQTIIHECIHYVLHSLFFRLQKIYLSDIRCIACPADLQVPKGSPVYRIEKQTAKLIPRLTMPAGPTRVKIRHLFEKEKNHFPGKDELFITERVIHDLSEFYGVSRESARIRMVELGYQQAKGTMIFCEDGYVPPYRFNGSSVKPNETFTIGIRDAFEEYTRNARFRQLIDSNRFVYVESHFCLRSPRYISIDPFVGEMHLSEYGRNHVDECCLRFQVIKQTGTLTYTTGTLKREKPCSTVKVIAVPDTWENDKDASVKIQECSLDESVDNYLEIKSQLPGTFSAALNYLMKRYHHTALTLSECSGVSSDWIGRIRRGGVSVTRDMVLSLCFGMHLEPELSYDLLSRAGKGFDDTRRDALCQFLLRTKYFAPIETINEILIAHHVAPLTKQKSDSKGFREGMSS